MYRWFGVVVISVAFQTPLVGQDTTVVRSRGPGVWRNPRLVEELRIGVLEGDDRYIFGSVNALAATRAGSLFVADAPGPRLRLYDANGKFVRLVGRAGSGPGEYRNIVGLQTTRDGNIALWDIPNHRISLFSSQGSFVSSFNLQGNYYGDDPFRADTGGTYWVFNQIPMPGVPQHVEGPGMQRPIYTLVSARGQILDTAFVPIPISRVAIPSFVLLTGDGPVQPFVSVPVFSPSNHGFFVTGLTTRYAINVHRPGSAILQIQRDYQPVRLAPEEKQEWDARARFYSRRGGASAGVRIPDVKPAFRALWVDNDGRIWVDRYAAAQKRANLPPPRGNPPPPAITWREQRTFDVFEPAGRFLGTITLPRNTRLELARGNLIWAVQRGELDVSYVVRFRLVTQ